MNFKDLAKNAIDAKPSLTPKIPMEPIVKVAAIEERVALLEDALLESLVTEDDS